MPLGLSAWEIVIVLLVVILLFGSSQLPKLGRQLGRGVRDAGREVAEVKKAFKAEDEKGNET
ncbi:MAG: twin-arginine translocase TatA/TatE family subunit [Gaiellaceae bacterium]